MDNKIWIGIVFFFLFISSVSAGDWTYSQSGFNIYFFEGNNVSTAPPYLYNNITHHFFNETQLNATIDARGGGADTKVKGDGIWLYNNTNTMFFNETKGNLTYLTLIDNAANLSSLIADSANITCAYATGQWSCTYNGTVSSGVTEAWVRLRFVNVTWTNYTLDSELNNATIIRTGNTSWVTSSETDAGHDECSEIAGCIETAFDNVANFTGVFVNVTWENVTYDGDLYTNLSTLFSNSSNITCSFNGSTIKWTCTYNGTIGAGGGGGGGIPWLVDNIYIYNGSSSTITFNETKLNSTIDNKLVGMTFNITSNYTRYGTPENGTISLLQAYDRQYFNISEIPSNGIEYYANTSATVTTDVNRLCIRYMFSNSGDTLTVWLQRTDTTWESYLSLTETVEAVWRCTDIPDTIEHIIDDKIVIKITHEGVAKATDKLSIDHLKITSGYSVQSTGEVDPNAIHRDNSRGPSADINWSGYSLYNVIINGTFNGLWNDSDTIIRIGNTSWKVENATHADTSSWSYDTNCANISGATSDLCTLTDTDTNTPWTVNDSWLYNVTGEINWNETKGDARYTLAGTKVANSTHSDTSSDSYAVGCDNVTGATSNLCTLTDTDTSHPWTLNTTWLYNLTGAINWNETKGDETYLGINDKAVNATHADTSSNSYAVGCGNVTGAASNLCTITPGGGGGAGVWLNNGTVITLNLTATGNVVNVNVPGNLSVGNASEADSLVAGYNGSVFNFEFANANVGFVYSGSINFSNNVYVQGTLDAPSITLNETSLYDIFLTSGAFATDANVQGNATQAAENITAINVSVEASYATLLELDNATIIRIGNTSWKVDNATHADTSSNSYAVGCDNVTGATSDLCTIEDTDTSHPWTLNTTWLYNLTGAINWNETKGDETYLALGGKAVNATHADTSSWSYDINCANISGAASNLCAITSSTNTTEEMQDAVWKVLEDGNQTYITVTYNDVNNSVNFIVGKVANATQADTAAALADNGANCAAGEIALGVDASGAVEGCYEPTEGDITDLVHTTDTTIGNCSVSNSCNNIVYTAELSNDTIVRTGNISTLLANSANITCTYATGQWTCHYNGTIGTGGSGVGMWVDRGDYIMPNASYAEKVFINQTLNISGNLSIGTGLGNDAKFEMYDNGTHFIFDFNASYVFMNATGVIIAAGLIDAEGFTINDTSLYDIFLTSGTFAAHANIQENMTEAAENITAINVSVEASYATLLELDNATLIRIGNTSWKVENATHADTSSWSYDTNCANISGATSDLCTIEDTDTSYPWTLNTTWLYNLTGAINWNETRGDARYTLAGTKVANSTHSDTSSDSYAVGCGNVTGATSNLCTLTDSDTDTNVAGDDIWLFNLSGVMYFNESKGNNTYTTNITITTSYVPYTGASANVDLGVYNIAMWNITATSTNNTLGNSSFHDYNSTCSGFKRLGGGGGLYSCV